jgi:squalene synthase HpnC
MEETEKIYAESLKFASSHYENFPVASFFIPKKFRKHVAVIYRFAREADDIADEGNSTADTRIAQLDEYENCFILAMGNEYKTPFWQALHHTIKIYSLTPDLFTDLLSAFKQDVNKKRYKDFSEISDYCRRSANPVGRLILELFGYRDPVFMNYSDNICTALQLTNFYQDISVDLEKGRIYIPGNEMEKFEYSEYEFTGRCCNSKFRNMLSCQIQRVSEMFQSGKPLISHLNGRLKLEIKATVFGGEKVLDKIIKNDYNVLLERPVLNKLDMLEIFVKLFIS